MKNKIGIYHLSIYLFYSMAISIVFDVHIICS